MYTPKNDKYAAGDSFDITIENSPLLIIENPAVIEALLDSPYILPPKYPVKNLPTVEITIKIIKAKIVLIFNNFSSKIMFAPNRKKNIATARSLMDNILFSTSSDFPDSEINIPTKKAPNASDKPSE